MKAAVTPQAIPEAEILRLQKKYHSDYLTRAFRRWNAKLNHPPVSEGILNYKASNGRKDAT
jgi:hypothetical protein